MSASRLFPWKKPFPKLSSPDALVRRRGTGTARSLAAPPPALPDSPGFPGQRSELRLLPLFTHLWLALSQRGFYSQRCGARPAIPAAEPAPLPSLTCGLWGRSRASEALPSPQVKGSAAYFPCSERVPYFHPPLHSSAPCRCPPSPSLPGASEQNDEGREMKAPITFLLLHPACKAEAGCSAPAGSPQGGLSQQQSFELNILP